MYTAVHAVNGTHRHMLTAVHAVDGKTHQNMAAPHAANRNNDTGKTTQFEGTEVMLGGKGDHSIKWSTNQLITPADDQLAK